MLECIASLASEYLSAINVLTGPKHYRTLQNRTFILRLHHADIYRAGKCRFQSDLKSQGCMLTHFLQISVILSTKRETYSNQFKCAYLKNQKPFVDILILFQNLHKIWNILKKMLSIISSVFLKFITTKNVDTRMHSRSCFRTSFDNQRVNGSHTLLNSSKAVFCLTFSLF